MPWAVFSDDQRTAIDEIYKSDSDRVTAVLGVALLDNTLRRTITERLNNEEDTVDKLFKISGPLGNTEPKVDLLFLLYGLPRPTRNACYGLIKARNLFAHKLSITFDSDDKIMTEAFGLLTLHDGLEYYPNPFLEAPSDHNIEDTSTRRAAYIVNLKLCLIACMRDRLNHRKWSNYPLSVEEVAAQRAMYEASPQKFLGPSTLPSQTRAPSA